MSIQLSQKLPMPNWAYSQYHLYRSEVAYDRNYYMRMQSLFGLNLAHWAYVTQMLRAKFAYDERHVARVHHANVARTFHARSAQQGVRATRDVTLILTTLYMNLVLAHGCMRGADGQQFRSALYIAYSLSNCSWGPKADLCCLPCLLHAVCASPKVDGSGWWLRINMIVLAHGWVHPEDIRGS
jgi:hypothetical protein